MAARRSGIPLIYHVHGLEAGRSSRPNPQLVALEHKGAEVADLVITVSEAMKGSLLAWASSRIKSGSAIMEWIAISSIRIRWIKDP